MSPSLLLIQTKIFGFKARRLRVVQKMVWDGVTLIITRIHREGLRQEGRGVDTVRL